MPSIAELIKANLRGLFSPQVFPPAAPEETTPVTGEPLLESPAEEITTSNAIQAYRDAVALKERADEEKRRKLEAVEAEREATGGFTASELKSISKAEEIIEAQREAAKPLYQRIRERPGFLSDPRPFSELEKEELERTRKGKEPKKPTTKEKTPLEIETEKVDALNTIRGLEESVLNLKRQAAVAEKEVPTISDIRNEAHDLEMLRLQVNQLRAQAAGAYNQGDKPTGDKILQEANKASLFIRDFKSGINLDEKIAAREEAVLRASNAEKQLADANRLFELQYGREEGASEFFFQKQGAEPISGRFVTPQVPALVETTGEEAADQLPPGAVQIGTSGGVPVYRTPDGRTFMSQ
jgi:hypothetical protein